MSVIKEFKEFALKGNLMDMAIAFVMGAAFGKLVTGFINGLIMPVVGLAVAGVNFKDLKYVLSPAIMDDKGVITKPESAILYGDFITISIDFLCVALVMFMIIKVMNKLKRKKAAEAPAEPAADVVLLSEIRDLLKK